MYVCASEAQKQQQWPAINRFVHKMPIFSHCAAKHVLLIIVILWFNFADDTLLIASVAK